MLSEQDSRAVGRRYLMEAFILLGAKKDINSISVTELCRKAGVNRSTFYKHFQDIPDLVHKLTQEYLDSLFFKTLKENLKGRPTNEVLIAVLEASLREKDLALLMFNNTGFETVRQRLFEEFRRIWPHQDAMPNGRQYLHSAYFFGGMCALWREWLLAPDSMTVQQVADDLQVLMNQAMNLGIENEQETL